MQREKEKKVMHFVKNMTVESGLAKRQKYRKFHYNGHRENANAKKTAAFENQPEHRAGHKFQFNYLLKT